MERILIKTNYFKLSKFGNNKEIILEDYLIKLNTVIKIKNIYMLKIR